MLFAAVCALAAGAASCGGESSPLPLPIPTPTVNALVLSCPADVQVQSPDGQPVVVPLPLAAAAGGAPPIQLVSGAPERFPVGQTTVSYTATDSVGQNGSCTFQVTVLAPLPIPKLSVTKFLAYGDSLTEGKTSLANGILVLTLPTAYTFSLQDLLARRYVTQAFSVVNEGYGGETTRDGVVRLPGTLSTMRPEVMLLMHGANDLLNLGSSGVAAAVENMGVMTRQAQGAGASVLVANLPPQIPGSRRGTAADVVPVFNDGVKQMSSQERAVLVDVFGAFQGDLSLVGPDGLHLSEAGYQRVAQAFFDAIKATFEVPAPTTPAIYCRECTTARRPGGADRRDANHSPATQR